MTPAQRKLLHKALLELKDQLSGKSPQKLQPNRTSEAEVGGDEDEQPLNEMLQAIASNRNKNTDLVLRKVERALHKLQTDPDDFGNCENCGDEILFGRLKAMPYAELCTECQAGQDAHKGRPTRKKLTDFQE